MPFLLCNYFLTSPSHPYRLHPNYHLCHLGLSLPPPPLGYHLLLHRHCGGCSTLPSPPAQLETGSLLPSESEIAFGKYAKSVFSNALCLDMVLFTVACSFFINMLNKQKKGKWSMISNASWVVVCFDRKSAPFQQADRGIVMKRLGYIQLLKASSLFMLQKEYRSA